jgi:hypothetical protein
VSLVSFPAVDEEQRFAIRAEKIEKWLECSGDLENQVYGDLLSRREETASLSGWNHQPKTRPCECRIQWLRGRLCLACDNTGWRPCAPGEEGIDPYSAQVEKRGSWLLNESDSTKRAAAQHRMDNEIDMLERFARIRQGFEGLESRELRAVRIVSGTRYLPMIRQIEQALKILLIYRPNVLSSPRRALARALAHLVEGRLYWPPVTS